MNNREGNSLNVLGLSVALTLDENGSGDAFIDFNLTIDGQYIHEPDVYVDPVDLTTSVGLDGELFIFTCSCGSPGCLGIDQGVRVTHSEGAVRWVLRNPISWPPGEDMPDWTHEAEFVFDRDEYAGMIRIGLEHAKTLIENWKGAGALWVGPDLKAEELLALEVPGQGLSLASEPENKAIH